MDINQFQQWANESRGVHSRLAEVRQMLFGMLEADAQAGRPNLAARNEIGRIYMKVCEAYELAGLLAQVERIALEKATGGAAHAGG